MGVLKTPNPIKWFGGKNYLAAKIVALMPRHRHYVEPYAGGLSVLLARDPNDKSLWLSESSDQGGVSEVVSDVNGDLTGFWSVLQNRALFPEFHRLVQMTPVSRVEWEHSGTILGGASDGPFTEATGLTDERLATLVVRAAAFFVRCRQSRAGQFKGFTSLTRNRTRRGVNGNVSEWLSAVDGLPAVHARLQPVVIESIPAVKLIHREDAPGTLFYLDPPYLHETRASKDVYAFEMSEMDHRELLATITHKKRQGKFMLSGYRSDLYDQFLGGWTRHDFELPNNAAGGKTKRRMTESLWVNW